MHGGTGLVSWTGPQSNQWIDVPPPPPAVVWDEARKAYQAVDADGIAWQWIPPGADPRHPKGVWVPLDHGQQLGPQVQDNPAAAAPGDFGARSKEWEAAGNRGKAPPPTLPLDLSLRKFPAPAEPASEETLAATHSSQDAFVEPCPEKMPLEPYGDPAGRHGLGIAAPVPDGPRHPKHASPQLVAKANAPGWAPMAHGGLPPLAGREKCQ